MFFAVIGVAALAFYGVLSPRGRLQLLMVFLLIGVLVALTLFYGIADFFTGEGITFSVLMHVRYGLDGGLGVLRFPWLAAFVIVCILLVLSWIWLCWRQCLRRKSNGNSGVSPWIGWLVIFVCLALLPLHPAIVDLRALYGESVAADLSRSLNEDLVWDEDPRLDRAKRSVVYIYLESFEATFLDENLFPGLAPRLKELGQEALVLKGISTSPFMNWTMGGMVASQCGMPMMTLPDDRKGGFRPGISCLGDLLSGNGYMLNYVGGADLGFSGKGVFYRQHGFEEVTGYEELLSEFGEETPSSIWGAFDETVFKKAQQVFLKLNESGGRFGLFLLTTATHPHSGYPGPSCTRQGARDFNNAMLNSVHCSDWQVYDFVRWLQHHGNEDLLIIIASDHLQVAGDATDLLNRSGERENLFMVLNDNIEPKRIRRSSTMVDVAPTVAGLMGFGITGIGLGRNLMLPHPTLAESYGLHKFNSMIPGWRVGLQENKKSVLKNRFSANHSTHDF